MPTPTVVQCATFASALNTAGGTTQRKAPMRYPCISGNTWIISGQCNGGSAPSSATDDQGNTYTLAKNQNSGQNVFCYYSTNITNGPKEARLNFASGVTFVSLEVAELNNIQSASPVDAFAIGAAGSGTTLTTGNLVTTVDGDLIVVVAAQVSTSARITSWAPGSGYTLLAADVEDSLCVQYKIEGTHGTTTPGMTMAPSHAWNIVAVAFKQSAVAQGSPRPAGLRVIATHHQGVNRAGTGASGVYQFPCFGDTLAIGFIGVSADLLTAVSDGTNTWTALTANTVHGGSGNCRAFGAKNVTPSPNLTATLTYGGTGAVPGDTAMFVDWIGGDLTTGFGATATDATIVGIGATIPNVATITPTAAGNDIFVTMGITSNTALGGNNGFISSTDPNQEVSPWPNDENNYWAIYTAPSTTPIVFTATTDAGAGNCASVAIEVLAASISTTPTLSSINPTSGNRGSTQSLSFVGTNFDTGHVAVNVSGTGVTAGTPSAVTATTMTVQFTVTLAAALTARNVSVTTDTGTSGNQTFTVTAATPVLTSISPTSGAQNTAPSVSFVGTGFDQGSATVNVSGTGVVAGAPSAVTATTFSSVFTIDIAAAQTARTVSVTTDGGTSGTKTFTVTAQVLGGVAGASSLQVGSEIGFTGAVGGSVILEG